MSREMVLFLALAVAGCGRGLPPTVKAPDFDEKKVSRRGPAMQKAKKKAGPQVSRYLAPTLITQEVDILRHLRYEEYPQDHGAPYRPGWTLPGETYPLDSVENVLANMRPPYLAMAEIVERPGRIEPADYDELRHHVGRLRMHADEIYRLKAGPEAGKVFDQETFAEATPSNEWCLKTVAGRLERATLLEATEELRDLWETYKATCKACNLGLVGTEESARRR